MGSSRRLREASDGTSERSRLSAWPERIVLAGCMALTVLAVLIPSEAAIPEGSFAPLAAGWCMLLVLWTAALWLAPNPQIRWGWTEGAAGALVLWHTLAALVHLGDGNDRQTLNALWLVVSYGAALFLWRQVLCSAAVIRASVLLMLLLATTLAAWGVFQTAYSFPHLRQEYAQNPTQLLAEQGLPSEAGSPQRELFENRLQSTEPLASFALTNSLAGFLAPWLIVAVWLAAGLKSNPDQRSARMAIWAVATLLGVCLLLTKSRTAYLATAAGLGLMPIVRRFPLRPKESQERAAAVSTSRISVENQNPQTFSRMPEQQGERYQGRASGPVSLRWAAVAGAVVVLAVGLATGAGFLDWKVLAEAPRSIRYRLEYWQATWAMIREQPLWGCGPGNFQTAYAHYKLPQSSEMVADPHNVLLEVAATAGLPALVLLLGMIAAFIFEVLQSSQLEGAYVTLESGEEPRQAKKRRAPIDVPVTTSSPETTLYWGSLAGLIAAVPLGLAVGFALETWAGLPVAWWLGVPLLYGFWRMSRVWQPEVSILPHGLILALVVLGLHLQAAGAMVFPGVMMTAVVLAPACLAVADPDRGWRHDSTAIPTSEAASKSAHIPVRGRRRSTASSRSFLVKTGLTAGAVALSSASLIKEYYPVLRCRSAMEQARVFWQAGQWDAAEQELRLASAADPYSPQPWELLAELRLQRWLGEPSDARWAALLEAADGFIRRDPRNHVAWFTRGHWFLRIWSKSGSDRDLQSALEAFQAAARLYPHRALYHAQLAWTLLVSGQGERAREQAERAWSLDQQMPHREQKLNRQKVFIVAREGDAKVAGPRGASDETAEQTVEWLRKLSVKPAEVEAKREVGR